jgi:hypothetical protein
MVDGRVQPYPRPAGRAPWQGLRGAPLGRELEALDGCLARQRAHLLHQPLVGGPPIHCRWSISGASQLGLDAYVPRRAQPHFRRPRAEPDSRVYVYVNNALSDSQGSTRSPRLSADVYIYSAIVAPANIGTAS